MSTVDLIRHVKLSTARLPLGLLSLFAEGRKTPVDQELLGGFLVYY